MTSTSAIKLKHGISLSSIRKSTITDQRKSGTSVKFKISKSFSDKPTPMNFNLFLPWICKEMQVPYDLVVRATVPAKQHRASNISAKRKDSTNSKGQRNDESNSNIRSLSLSDVISSTTNEDITPIIPVDAYYDISGRLVEIAIVGCTVPISKHVIQAISFCFPFHPFLTKLKICKGGLHFSLLIEIGKILSYSHLTDLCLDDTNVPQGNYYVLLDYMTHLKYLSMSRCSITDDICTKIFQRLKHGCPAERSLNILNLSSNCISDVGTKSIGEVLRENRHLLHLNLAGNYITDIGFDFILRHLVQFPLTYDEVIGSKRKYLEYCKHKLDVYNRCLEEIQENVQNRLVSLMQRRVSRFIRLSGRKKDDRKRTIVAEAFTDADRMTRNIVGEFLDPFDDANTVKQDNYLYCIGNVKLCSLNMSYNKLHLVSLMKIIKVLRYQDELQIKYPNTGLLRIVLEGNPLPKSCPELEKISMYLRKAVLARAPNSPSSPSLKKRVSPKDSKN